MPCALVLGLGLGRLGHGISFSSVPRPTPDLLHPLCQLGDRDVIWRVSSLPLDPVHDGDHTEQVVRALDV